MSDRIDDRSQRPDYAAGFAYLIEQALLGRRNAQVRTLDNEKSSEVCVALLARQVTLAQHLAFAPGFWTIHVAPLIFRCMTDININLAWISQDPECRSKKFIKYGLGQAKLNLEHRRSMESREGRDEKYSQYVDAKESWIARQRIEELVNVNLGGSWSGKSTREMAQEAGCEEVYEFEYLQMTRFSHIDWMSIFTLHPVQFEGYQPDINHDQHQTLAGITPVSELYLATKMIIHAFESYDNVTGFSSNDTLRLKQFRDYIRPMESSEIRASFSSRFTVQNVSGVAANNFQDKLRQSLGVLRGKVISSIELRIDRIRDVFREPETTAVLIPILKRLASLVEHYFAVPQAWNAHIAPIILRVLAEIMLKVVWLLGDPFQRSCQFIDASILQERNDLLCLEKALKERDFSSDVALIRDLKKSDIESRERLFPRVRNKKHIPKLRTIAKNGGFMDYYNLEISEWSACVHSSWHHVGFHNLIHCQNSLHRFHRVPTISPLTCDLRYLQSAIECCQRSLDVIDKMPRFDQDETGPSLLQIFDDEITGLRTIESRDSVNLDGRQQHLGTSPMVRPTNSDSRRISEQSEQVYAAALRGDSEAQFLLAQAHWFEVLSDSSASEAIRLLVQAGEQGHVQAQFQLAWIRAEGPAEHRDLVEALVWLIRLTTLARFDAELEDEIVALRMDVSSKLSVEELSSARERALSDAT